MFFEICSKDKILALAVVFAYLVSKQDKSMPDIQKLIDKFPEIKITTEGKFLMNQIRAFESLEN